MVRRLGGLFGNTIDSPPVNRIFRRPELTPEPESPTLEWGGQSSFIIPPQSQSGGVTWPSDPAPDAPEGELQRTFTEVNRFTSSVRIENPADSSQFVVVERIDRLLMTDSSNGESIVMIFNNPAA